MLDVALIYLPHEYLKQPDAQAPIGLLYLAAVLEEAQISVEVCNLSGLAFTEAVHAVPKAILYGITATTMEIPIANRFARLLKEVNSDCKIVIGGPSAKTPSYIDLTVIDSVCAGEGESVITKIYKDTRDNKLLTFYDGGFLTDINSIPFPARHKLDSQGGNIFAYNKNYKGTGSTVILSSRGCPNKCSFCSAPSFGNRKVRFRSPENVVAEIKEVIEIYGIKQFRFSDDMFTVNRKRVLDLCKLLKPLDIVWRISCRAKPSDYELFKQMYDAGLREMSIGVESFDDDVLKLLDKGLTVADNIKCLEICNKIGIKTRILMMIRTPGQTESTIQKNIECLNNVPYGIVACTTFVPLPGSDIWNNPDKYNIEILDKDFSKYNFYFFDKGGEIPLNNVIRLKGRDMGEVNKETDKFKKFLKSTGKLNEG